MSRNYRLWLCFRGGRLRNQPASWIGSSTFRVSYLGSAV